jgi:hypothetical protein
MTDCLHVAPVHSIHQPISGANDPYEPLSVTRNRRRERSFGSSILRQDAHKLDMIRS